MVLPTLPLPGRIKCEVRAARTRVMGFHHAMDFAPSAHGAYARHGLRFERIDYEETTMRSKDPAPNAVPSVRDLERKEQAIHPLPESRRLLHRAAHTGRLGALPARELEARQVLTAAHNRHTRVTCARQGSSHAGLGPTPQGGNFPVYKKSGVNE